VQEFRAVMAFAQHFGPESDFRAKKWLGIGQITVAALHNDRCVAEADDRVPLLERDKNRCCKLVAPSS
jgi:hypothetical protein